MPLLPLPEHNTPRVLIHYTSGGLPHSVDLRVVSGTTKLDAETETQAVIDAMLPCMDSADSVTGATWIPAGTNIGSPMAVIPGPGTTGPTAPTDESRAAFISATGRSDDGRKVRWTFYSINFQNETVFRKTVLSFAPVFQALYAAISGNTVWTTISGQVPSWHSYFNIGLNAGVQRKLR